MRRTKAISQLLQFTDALVSDTADLYSMFSDLVGSTEYKSNLISQGLPDIVWIQRQLVFLSRCADIIKKYEGTIVKTIGDEIFAFFQATTDPLRILNCAVEIVQGFGNIRAYRGISQIHAKVSIDFGSVYNGSINKTVPFDPIGVPVDRCARLMSFANQDEVIFSKDFLNICSTKKGILEIRREYGYRVLNHDLKGLGKTMFYSFKAK